MTKQEAIKLIDDRMCFGRGKWSEHHMPEIDDYWEAGQMAIKKLKQPEREAGHWIPVDSYSAFGGDEATWMAHGNPIAFYYCSKCKEQAYAGEDGESLLTDFCPNCGADMRGEQNDEKASTNND